MEMIINVSGSTSEARTEVASDSQTESVSSNNAAQHISGVHCQGHCDWCYFQLVVNTNSNQPVTW